MHFSTLYFKCQEVKYLQHGHSFYAERATESVTGIGPSDIGGLVTDRSMVRRERCRLRAWIKICQHSIFVDRSNRKCPKLLRDAFQRQIFVPVAGILPLDIGHNVIKLIFKTLDHL